MKCPHCNKTIYIKKVKEYDHPIFGEGFIKVFIFNFMMYVIPFSVIMTWLDNHTSIPLSIEDGLSFNLGVTLMLPVVLFVLGYCILYRYKILNGTLLWKQ